MSLQTRYEELCETPSDISEHLPTFVSLVRKTNAKHVVELGTRSGVSTIAWLYGLEHTGGHLTSVDLDPQPEIGDHDHWTFIQGDDLDRDVYLQLPDRVDIVFIDSSHAYKHTLVELNLYRWLVRPGGLIMLHDTENEQPFEVRPQPPFPVKRAVNEFCEAEGLTWENRPNNWGLGIIRL